MKMSRNQARRTVMGALTKAFGDPSTATDTTRQRMLNLVSAWMHQAEGKARDIASFDKVVRGPRIRRLGESRYTVVHDTLANADFMDRARGKINEAAHFGTTRGRLANIKLVPKFSPTGSYAVMPEVFTIHVSPNWHNTVVKHGIKHDGLKIVQKIWNHRDYQDGIQAWECLFWDLGKIENPHAEGWVVRAHTTVIVDSNLSRAIKRARQIVAEHTTQSIMKDIE